MLRDSLARVVDAYNNSMKFVKRLDVHEWARKYRELDTKASPIPYDPNYAPYMNEVMHCLSDSRPDIEDVVLMKPARSSGTESAINFLGSSIHQDPSNIAFYGPGRETLNRVLKQSIDPLFESKAIAPLIDSLPTAKKKTDNTSLKSFPGGDLHILSVTARNLRQLTLKRAILDEADECPLEIVSANGNRQGFIFDLIRNRGQSYNGLGRKMLFLSSPTEMHRSLIYMLFLMGDQRYFYVPCPKCGFFQHLDFYRLKVPDNKNYEDVYYPCEKCEFHIHEVEHKKRMLDDGHWRAHNEKPDEETIASFFVSGMYIPQLKSPWSKLKKKWDEACKEDNFFKKRDLLQTKIGWPTEEEIETPKYEFIFGKRENWISGTCPKGSLMLVAGVDVQEDRIAVEFQTFGMNRERWSIFYDEFKGNPLDPNCKDSWGRLEELMIKKWDVEGTDYLMELSRLCVDANWMDYRVYAWARKFPLLVIPIKGKGTADYIMGVPHALDVGRKTGKKLKKSLSMRYVGTHYIKKELFDYLAYKMPKDGEAYPFGYIHHPYDRDEKYFQMICNETQVFEADPRTGLKKMVWKQSGPVEALDTSVYCRAAAFSQGYDRWDREEMQRRFDIIYASSEIKNADIDESVMTDTVKSTIRKIKQRKKYPW